MTITDTESGTVFTPVDNSIDFNTSPTKTVKLPINATYLVELSGTLTIPQTDTSSISIPYYGSETFTLSTENPTADVNVIVGAKKTTEGGGSFDFSMVIDPTDEELTGYFSKADASSFTVKLVPYNSSNSTATEIELTNKTYTAPATTETASLSFTSDASEDSTIAAVDVPSGFYKLEVIFSYNDKTVNIAKSCDNLVEIVDGIKTSGSANVYVTYDDYKIFYGTTADDDTTYSGNFASKPKNVDKIIESDPTASTVQINMTDSILPNIDLTKWNNTNYSICDSSAKPQFYTQKNEAGTTLSSITVYGGPSIPLVISNSSAVSGKQDVVNLGTDSTTFTANSNLYLTVNNSICVNITNKDWVGGLYIENESYDETYNNSPIIKSAVSLTGSITLSDALTSKNYMIVEEADSTSGFNYYIRASTDQNVNVSGIPSFKLAVKKADGSSVTENTFVSVDDTLTFSLTEDVANFPTGTTFTWAINGTEVTSNTVGATITTGTPALTLTIGECESCTGNTTVVCNVTAGSESASASFSFTPSEEVVVAYDISSSASTETIGFYKYNAGQTAYENVLSDLTSPSVSDLTIDSDNNVYSCMAISDDSNNVTGYKIRKSTYNSGGTVTSVDYTVADSNVSNLQYLEVSSSGNLYIVVYNSSYQQELKKVELSTDGTNTGTVTSIEITSLMTDTYSTPIDTFYVDDSDASNINYYFVVTHDTKTLYKCTNTIDLTSAVSISLYDGDKSITTDVLNSMNIFSNGPTITDMTLINGKLYLIANEISVITTATSRGAVAVLTESGTTFTSSELYGFYDGEATITGTGSTDEPHYVTYEHDEGLFYGPKRILAIKPDEIIISDDGFTCNASSPNGGSVTNKNRYAIFNLSGNSFTFKDASCEFDNYYSMLSLSL